MVDLWLTGGKKKNLSPNQLVYIYNTYLEKGQQY